MKLTHTALSFGFFDFLIGGEFDEETGHYYAPECTGSIASSSIDAMVAFEKRCADPVS